MANLSLTLAVVLAAVVFASFEAAVLQNPISEKNNQASVATLDAFSTIQAESFSISYGGWSIENIIDGTGANVTVVESVGNGDYIGYIQVDFGAVAKGVTLRMASWVTLSESWGKIHFVLDDPSGPPFHTVVFGNNNSGLYWITITEYLNFYQVAENMHDLYLRFEIDNGDSNFVFVD